MSIMDFFRLCSGICYIDLNPEKESRQTQIYDKNKGGFEDVHLFLFVCQHLICLFHSVNEVYAIDNIYLSPQTDS